LHDNLPLAAERFVKDGVFSTWTMVEAATFSENLAAGLEALGSAFFRSSAIVLDYPLNELRITGVQRIIKDAQRVKLGVLMLVGMEETLPQKGNINVVFERPQTGWKISLDLGQADLALLIGYKLKRNWQTDLLLTASLVGTEEENQAMDYLKAVAELARIPNARLITTSAETAADSTVTLFTMTAENDIKTLGERAQATGMPCIFAMDGGNENALA